MYTVFPTSIELLHSEIFVKTRGKIAANAGECLSTTCGKGSIAKSRGVRKHNGRIFCMGAYLIRKRNMNSY